ncbi:uncharacterized protein [Leptinotarsa decemlineata]|uniref:uncharacterized protein n=1 Tax=Leptinotarsa decemlineata TaxID=7539 RepID=UPI003D306FFB
MVLRDMQRNNTMDSMNASKSVQNLRYSQRLKEKKEKLEAKSDVVVTAVEGQGAIRKSPSKLKGSSRSSQASRLKKLEIETAIKKKTLEKELIDLELALKVAEIEENSDESESMSMHQSQKPNVEDWIDGKTPWTNGHDGEDKHSIFMVKEDELVRDSHSKNSPEKYSTPFFHNNMYQMTLPQMTKILTRQSLPRELPIFDGNPSEWPNFIYHYNNSDAICGFSNEENQSRLQKCLKGNAKKIVQSLLIMPQNVDKVIDLLKNRFGRPDHIIMMLLEKIKKFPPVREEKLELFIEFCDEIKNFVATIESLNEEEHLHNSILVNEIMSKLPTSYQLSWVEHLSKLEKPRFKLVELGKWLDEKANAASQIQIPKYDIQENTSKSKYVKKGVTLATSKKSCICCKKNVHHLTECSEFKSMPVDGRWSIITENKICFSCLSFYHNLKQCRKRKVCGVQQCPKFHHKLLHKDVPQTINEGNNVDDSAIVGTNSHVFNNKSVLLKILPVVVTCRNKTVETYALLDDASTISLIDEEFANYLGLDGPIQSLSLQWTNDDLFHQQNDSKVVSFTISSKDNGPNFQMRHVRTTKLSLPSQTVDFDKIRMKYPYIQDKISPLKDAQPRILIGQDNWPLLVNRKLISGPWNGPALSKTLLGWVIHGNLDVSSRNEHIVCHISTHDLRNEKDDLDILHEMVKENWKLETVQSMSDKVLSIEDKRAQHILDTTMKRSGERFETGLLWKKDNIVLPESRTNALKRLNYIERKMDRDEKYGEIYCEKIQDMEKKGYIKKLTKKEANNVNEKTWYLPHFGVTNVNKPNKLRIVFDASVRSHGVSLNDNLLTGPDLYNSMNDILLNFRIKKYAFTADIKEMFLQVKVRPEDCSAQRILWRGKDRRIEPDTYEIVVVFFGSTCGPCLAQEAKNRNAEDFREEFPEAATAIIQQHYMDDYLGSADTLEESISLIKDVIHVHKAGGFVICNWITNHEKISQSIDVSLLASGGKNMEKNGEFVLERILGVFWNPHDDTFSFQTKFQKIDSDILEHLRRPTKREILKVLMSIFDPLGFLANFLIQGKILLQDIWRSQIGWDDEISDCMDEKWQLWIADLKTIHNFKIHRQYFTLDRQKSEIQLHIFCDASEKCYAAVAYLRIQQGEKVETSFITAKTRVAPLKPLSIPRLELQAALMGARLGHFLKKTLDMEISAIWYWSDSKTVLHWIRSEARRFKVFVAQRLGEIQDLTNSSEWKYINSKENVADEATKRLEKITFSDNNRRWITGPDFLILSPDQWPKEKMEREVNIDHLEERPCEFVFYHFIQDNLIVPDPNRFSKWKRLLRATAYVIRFYEIIKNHSKFKSELTAEEICKAEVHLFRKIQLDSFNEEMTFLRNKMPIRSKSRLYTLSCSYSEDDGLIRLSGRLDQSIQLTDSAKRPIVLDPNHRITKLLIQHYHEMVHHHGQEMVVNNLRMRFWILRMRQAVRSAWNSCQHCKNQRALPRIPMMGQLPPCRIEPTIRAFIKTGVDYFGPLEVSVKRSREKRYGVIFTCMVTRAIHLEIAHDLSTNSFINVLRQFGCRRGFPEELYSDNGKNFIGAEKEISQELKKLNQDEILRFCAMKKIKWVFNPPLAPHMGGCWERLIQSIKKVLKEILKSKYYPEHILRTFLIECENILNSRPLTYVSLDSEDAEALTPNHFLIGPSYAALSCTETSDRDMNLMSSWRAAQKLSDLFWFRWTKEYLPSLIRRSKWHGDSKSVSVGDVVLMVDPNGPRNIWQRGIINEVYPAKDGKIRIVDVKNSSGTIFRRPVSRLIVLDVIK